MRSFKWVNYCVHWLQWLIHVTSNNSATWLVALLKVITGWYLYEIRALCDELYWFAYLSCWSEKTSLPEYQILRNVTNSRILYQNMNTLHVACNIKLLTVNKHFKLFRKHTPDYDHSWHIALHSMGSTQEMICVQCMVKINIVKFHNIFIKIVYKDVAVASPFQVSWPHVTSKSFYSLKGQSWCTGAVTLPCGSSSQPPPMHVVHDEVGGRAWMRWPFHSFDAASSSFKLTQCKVARICNIHENLWSSKHACRTAADLGIQVNQRCFPRSVGSGHRADSLPCASSSLPPPIHIWTTMAAECFNKMTMADFWRSFLFS